MLETRAIVIKVEGREALVEAVHGGGCGACGGGNSCGSGKLAEAFCVRPRQFRALNEVNAHVGEEVEISVQDGALFRSALTLYGLPLLLLFAGAASGEHWLGGAGRDGGAAIGALAGLLAGFALAAAISVRSRRAGTGAVPSISRRNAMAQQPYTR
jgi:sigma-E factor negative regulatory protein RseC